MRLFYYFNFERNYDVFMTFSLWIMTLKSKSQCILLNKNINFHKNKTESNMENPTHSFRETCFSSYKNCKLKVKLWWVGARDRKKRAFFVSFILSEENFLTCFIAMYSALNTLLEYAYVYILKNITSHTF